MLARGDMERVARLFEWRLQERFGPYDTQIPIVMLADVRRDAEISATQACVAWLERFAASLIAEDGSKAARLRAATILHAAKLLRQETVLL